jgi:hypothetical protein
VHARPGCEQHAAATRVIHEARRVAAQEAIDSGGVGDGNRRALEDALLAHPVYRRIRGQVLNFDGV